MWGQPVVVDNRPGAGGMIAFANMKQVEKDEYSFAFTPASSMVLSPYMYKSANVDIARDLTPVAYIGESPMIVAVKAGSPINSFADLLAAMKKQPDTLVAAVPLQFSLPHLTTELLSKANGASLRVVPYPGSSQGAAAVVGDEVQVVIDGVPPLEGLIQGNRLKGLATFGARRLPNHPDWPTVSETFPGMVVNGWFGIFALTGTNPQVVQKVNADVAKAVMTPEVMEKMNVMAVYPRNMSVPEMTAYLASERNRWEKALKDVGAKPAAQQ